MSDEFRRGQKVRCIDATHHCHFLEVGKVYTVDVAWTAEDGTRYVSLVGMARGWPVEQFEVVLT